MGGRYFVSITGLRLKRAWHAPIFWVHAIASMRQVHMSEGCVSAETRTINGVHHTVSVWESEAHMRRYMTKGAHKRALAVFRSNSRAAHKLIKVKN